MADDLQTRLAALALSPEQFVNALPPPVRSRITTLLDLQEKHDEFEEQYQKEVAELQAKYAKLYAPLYDERAKIVSGTGAEPTEGGAAGIPDFWQVVLMRASLLRESMNEKDPDVLKYLTDVRSEDILGSEDSGFKLIFTFTENPYFSNTTLEKRYYMLEDGTEPVLERSEGTAINWKPGKNVTVKVMKKKPKKGGRADAKPLTKTEPVESFFNFFTPPQVPDEDAEDLDEEELEALHEEIENDYDMGAMLRLKLIPNAVKWYTGEAVEEEGMDEYEDEDEDEDEDDDGADDDDEDGDEDDGDEEPTTKKAKGKKGPSSGGAGAAGGEQPQECKQQ